MSSLQNEKGLIMKKRSIRSAFLFLLLATWIVGDLQAQRFGGGFGGFGTQSSQNRREYFSNGMVGDAIITADLDTRRIIVIADDETNEHISKIIESLDRPQPQVLIKVVFVEVTYRNDSDIGVEGTGEFEVSNSSARNILMSSFGPAGSLATGGTYTVSGGDFSATLRAIKEIGSTEVLSRPSVLTRNNQEAVITIGEEVPFITNSQTTDVGTVNNTVDYDDVGIILRVTPFITENGLVEMIVAPEISSVSERGVPISATVEAPIISKRSAETVVVTEHGQTIVIGGLMQNNKIETTRKVPILGDIPLLGLAFRRKIKEDQKTELLIFVTPYVVQEPADITKLNQSETDKTEITNGVFTEKEVAKYIEGARIEPKEEKKKKEKKEANLPAPKGSN